MDGVRALRVIAHDKEGGEQIVWELDSTLQRDNGWPETGQCGFEAHQVSSLYELLLTLSLTLEDSDNEGCYSVTPYTKFS